MSCLVADCSNTAACKGLCWAHYRRQARGRPLGGDIRKRYQTKREAVMEAMLAFLDVSSEDDAGWAKAWHRVRMAWRRYSQKAKRNHVQKPRETLDRS